MTPNQIGDMLRSLGVDQVKVHGNRVECCCPVAFWTHPKGRDSRPSCVVFPEPRGDADDDRYRGPIYTCLSCHDKGSVWSMLLFLLSKGQDTWGWLEVLSGDGSAEKADRQARVKRSGVVGLRSVQSHPEVRKAMSQVTRAPVVASTPATFSDGRPWYDYRALQKAEDIEEIPWSEYEKYAGGVPRYALDRGLTLETCKEWQLGNDKGRVRPTWNASPKMPRHITSQRLLFPIRDRKGRLVAISGRLYATGCFACGGAWARSCGRCDGREDEHFEEDGGLLCSDGSTFEPTAVACVRCDRSEPPKYLHRKGFKRNLLLFGEHRVEDETDGRVYVVEGHLDMMRLWQFGYRPVVATLGSYPGATQIEKMIKLWKKVIVVPDGNQAGADLVRLIKEMVAGRIPVSSVKMPQGNDPGDLPEDKLRELLREPPWPRLSDPERVALAKA